LGPWGSEGGGKGLVSLAVGPDGTVYVVDAGNGRIQVFAADGTHVSQWGSGGNGDGQFAIAFGIAVAPDGKAVYVTDADLDRVQVFDPDGTYVDQWGTSGNGDGQFSGPAGIAVAPDGTVYVADQGNNRVQVFCVPPFVEGTERRATPGASTPVVPPSAATPVATGSGPSLRALGERHTWR
jgi:DNA-binding beta-propeller fold protein YncE